MREFSTSVVNSFSFLLGSLDAATDGNAERTSGKCRSNVEAYLNALSRAFPHGAASDAGDPEMVPTPPTFSRDYATSLLEFALIGQAVESDQVLLTRTKFQIDGEPVDWQLLLVPDAASMANLRALFPTEADTP